VRLKKPFEQYVGRWLKAPSNMTDSIYYVIDIPNFDKKMAFFELIQIVVGSDVGYYEPIILMQVDEDKYEFYTPTSYQVRIAIKTLFRGPRK
jgi:hypothetical protein